MIIRFFLIFSFVFLTSYSSYLQAKEYTREEIDNFFAMARGGSWSTEDKDILKLQSDEYGRSVAHILAQYNPNWSSSDKDILELQENAGITVEDILKERNS